MPKQVTDLKEFLALANRADAKGVKVKKNAKNQYKFKIRCSKYLYTLVLNDQAKAKKLKDSLPPTIEPKNI